MKTGEWARYLDSYEGVVKFGIIESIDDNGFPFVDVAMVDCDYYISESYIKNTAKNPIDLLEVHDIIEVDLITRWGDEYREVIVIKDDYSLEYWKRTLKNGDDGTKYKIAEILLYENKILQKMKEG